MTATTMPTPTETAINNVLQAMSRHGGSSIIALAGPPATGKTHIAQIAAQRHAGDPTRVTPLQFHPNYTYEQFMNGLQLRRDGSVGPTPGEFLRANKIANEDGVLSYVVLIDELTRADVPAVLGELLTYIEYRGRAFTPLYGGPPVTIAERLVVLATFNPVDRSALELDDAVMRRLEILSFPPDTGQLVDMLQGRLPAPALDRLVGMFRACQEAHAALYGQTMPFGHGMFAKVNDEYDLFELWDHRIRHLLYRPFLTHPFAHTIESNYPWTKAGVKV